MTTPDLTPILEDLAAGRIDAAEASRRIEALKSRAATDQSSPSSQPGEASATAQPGDASAASASQDAPSRDVSDGSWKSYARETFGDDEQPAAEPDTPSSRRPSAQAKGVERVAVRAVGRRVRIVGEPRVATASVDGQHVLRRNGSTLEISSDGEIGASIDGFTLLRPPRSLEDVRNLGLGRELFIRVNPELIVDVELTAGSLTCENVRYLGKVRVTAGGAKLTGISEADDVLVQAGQATVKGCFASGRSRIRCESGTLNVQLEDRSNVTVRAESQLGKVAWAGGHSGAGDEVVMGNGSARLDVGVVMGHALVKVGTDTGEA